MGMGPRPKRIKRLRAIFPVLEEMEQYAEQIRDNDLFNPGENPYGEDLWLPTPFTRTRDSDLREQCNWEVVTEAMAEALVLYREERYSHWGWGWSERVYVRKDDAAAIKLTQEFVNALSEYAVLDDARLSALETEELNEYLQRELSGYPGDDDDAYLDRVREWLRDMHDAHRLEDVSQDMVKKARRVVHHPYDRWVDTYTNEESCFFCGQAEPAECHNVTPEELKSAGQLSLPEQP